MPWNTRRQEGVTVEEMFWKSERERRIYELQEKVLREKFSALAEARAEGEAGGEIKGKIDKAQDNICKLLKKKFAPEAGELPEKVRQITSLDQIGAK